MNYDIPEMNSRYHRYVELLVAQHHLLRGKAPGDDLEAIEDEMAKLWDMFGAAQRQSLSGLGSDLHWIRRGAMLAPKARAEQEVSDLDLQALYDARDCGDWHRALHQLRVCSARIAPFELAFLRATAWQVLGLTEIARLFSQFAAQLEPSNARLAILPLPLESKADMPDRAGSIN